MIIRLEMRDQKLQYDINREAAKISALSSRKIDKYEYLTGEEILQSDQSRIIEQVTFTYSPLRKSFWKTNKNNWRKQKKTSWSFKSFKTRGKKWHKSIDGLFPSELMRTNEIKNEINNIKKWKNKTNQKDLKYKTKNYLWFSATSCNKILWW